MESITEKLHTIVNTTKLSKPWVIYDKHSMMIRGRFFLKVDAEKKLRRIKRSTPNHTWTLAIATLGDLTEAEWKMWTLLQKENW